MSAPPVGPGPVGAESVSRRSWTSEEYHAHPAISRSQIVDVLSRPEHYHARYEARTLVDEEGAALRFGKLLHLRVLEPERFAAEVAVRPEGLDLRSKEGRAWKLEVQAARKMILDNRREGDLIESMASSLLRRPSSSDHTRRIFQAGLKHGRCEQAWTWRDHVTGLEVKALHDIVRDDIGMIIDLKTTSKTDPRGIAWSIREYSYHVQAAVYSEPLRLLTGREPRFVLVFVFKEPPHEVCSFDIDEELLSLGREQMRSGLDEIYARRRSGDWSAEWTKWPITVGLKGLKK